MLKMFEKYDSLGLSNMETLFYPFYFQRLKILYFFFLVEIGVAYVEENEGQRRTSVYDFSHLQTRRHPHISEHYDALFQCK